MLEDTIIAVSTPPGIGGLGVVRLSGARAVAVAGKIFKSRRKSLQNFPARRPVMGNIFDPEKKEAFDEAVLTYYRAPHSYTREDVVELSAHGSPVILEEIVRLGVRAGARPAHPGEFTLRAYLNGRLDILQAGAVDDLIRAASLTQARVSFRQLKGGLSIRIARLRESLVRLAAQVEAAIEFPEEIVGLNSSRHARAINRLIAQLERLIASFEAGRALREGVNLAITGRTNVGKSTLFNALLEEDRAIVTPYPGTTRDFLRERIIIDDIVFHLYDMAGLGKPGHPVEKKGILKGQMIAREADGLLVVLDGSRKATPEDERLIKRFRGKKHLLVFNKADLPPRLDPTGIHALAGDSPILKISALKGIGMDRLRAEIRRYFAPAKDVRDEVIQHAWQRDLLGEVRDALGEARRLLGAGQTEEVYAEELRRAIFIIGRLTGEIRAEDLMRNVFGRFCVGK